MAKKVRQEVARGTCYYACIDVPFTRWIEEVISDLITKNKQITGIKVEMTAEGDAGLNGTVTVEYHDKA